MSDRAASLDLGPGASASRAPALGAALPVIATAQLVMVLDDTVANVALPSIEADLGKTAAALPWVINASILTFGGLLPLGGRAGELFGAGAGSSSLRASDPRWSRSSRRGWSPPGFALAIAGLLWLSALDPGATYWGDLMVPFSIASAGLGLAFFPMTLTVVHGVDDRRTGVASAVMSTAQQVGAAIGLAVLTTVAATTAADHLPNAATGLNAVATGGAADLAALAADALSHGYTTAFMAQAAPLAVAALVVAVMVTTRTRQHTTRPGETDRTTAAV